MASAYVALLSLDYTIEQHQRSIIFPERFQVDFLKETNTFLLQFFETHSQKSSEEIPDLERRIVDAAIEAGCLIDSHAMDQTLVKYGYSGDNSSQLFPEEDIHRIMKEFESIKEKAMEIMVDIKSNEAQLSTGVMPAAGPSRRSPGAENNTMVGFDHHFLKVMERIRGHKPTLQILPIVGTGGIGKSTLTRAIYENENKQGRFDICLWANISHSYTVRDILMNFMHDLHVVDDQISALSIEELGGKLYQSLYSKRYLIVLDDIWRVELWDAIKRFLPQNGNKSRIIVTTRLLSVASYMGPNETPHELEYLDEDESWNLLKRRVFGQDECPSWLDDIGRRIAVSCKGLPLAIVAIAGQLANSDLSEESWENVERAIISILHSETDIQCLAILSLSYDNLPVYLKPCFLYMGYSQDDTEFRVHEKIRLWVAHGLVRPSRDESLEDTAMKYLTDLVGRNLIMVSKRGPGGKIKRCRIHNLLQDICIRKARECHFLGKEIVGTDRTINGPMNIPLCKFPQRYVSFDLSTTYWENEWNLGADVNLLIFRLRCIELSASQAMDISSFSAPLALIPVSQNLQTLLIKETPEKEPVILPPRFWEMSFLRHLDIKRVVLPDPPSGGEESCVLESLQTLQDVHFLKLTEDVVKRIPNVKKLKLTYRESAEEWPCYCLHNLSQLCKLESLSLSVCRLIPTADISLPQSLKKLSLDGCKLPWEDMTMVGSLPNLEVLRLQNDAFYGKEWRPAEDEFCRLKVLHLQNMYLEQWEVDSCHFPRLEKLIFHNVWRMKEIPFCLGEIETLQLISIDLCRLSFNLSVGRLVVERKKRDDDVIEIHLRRQPFMQFMLVCLFSLLISNSCPPHDSSVTMIEKFEDDLRQFQAFLRYTTKNETNDDERLKELVKQIRDVMYEALDAFSIFVEKVDLNEPLSYSFRRLLSAVKEVEYVGVRVQRLLFTVGEGYDEEPAFYKDPVDLIDWNTDDEAYNTRILHMINQHMNIMEKISTAEYLDPVGRSTSKVQFMFRDFALLSVVDGISEDDEAYETVYSKEPIASSSYWDDIELESGSASD